MRMVVMQRTISSCLKALHLTPADVKGAPLYAVGLNREHPESKV